MKSCRKCGFSNDDSMQFCVECGTALKDSPQMVVPLDSLSGTEKPTEEIPAASESETVVANRFAAPGAQKPSTSGGKRAIKIFIGIIVAGVLLVTFAAAGVILAVYLSIIDAAPRPIVSRRETPTPTRTPRWIVKSTPKSTPEATPEPSPTIRIEIDAVATRKTSFEIQTDESWQVSKVRTIGSENFIVTATGNYELDGIKKRVTARGVSGHKERRLFKDFRTGALLMRTHYPDGRHSNIQAVSSGKYWQNYPDEEGNLEFIVNDNDPDENDGDLTIRFEMTDKEDS